MPHLKALQKKYKSNLQVIAVSDETPKRIGQYLSSKPSNLWFAADTAREIEQFFPHRIVPHTVLISPEGRLIANTSPELLTDPVIDSILTGKQVHLAVKKDYQYTTPENLISTVFPAADTVRQRFILEGEIPGAPGMSTTYRLDSIWNGRRLTAINCNIIALYRLAYDFPFNRIINKTGLTDRTATRYRLDIIVSNKTELLPHLQDELQKKFDIQPRLMQELKDVYVLQIADKVKFDKIPRNTSRKRTFFARHGEIDQQAINMTDFASFLENYGAGNLYVIDETKNNEKFDLKFSYQPENPQSLTDILAGMGLRLNKEKRNVAMLMLYRDRIALKQ